MSSVIVAMVGRAAEALQEKINKQVNHFQVTTFQFQEGTQSQGCDEWLGGGGGVGWGCFVSDGGGCGGLTHSMYHTERQSR